MLSPIQAPPPSIEARPGLAAPFSARAGSESAAAIDGAGIGLDFLAFGITSALGNAFGGVVVDRIGPVKTQAIGLSVLVIALSALPLLATTLPAPIASYAVIAATAAASAGLASLAVTVVSPVELGFIGAACTIAALVVLRWSAGGAARRVAAPAE